MKTFFFVDKYLTNLRKNKYEYSIVGQEKYDSSTLFKALAFLYLNFRFSLFILLLSVFMEIIGISIKGMTLTFIIILVQLLLPLLITLFMSQNIEKIN